MPVYGFLANFGARRFPKGNEGKTQGGLPLGNPVCLWQTELFKLNLKSSPSSSGYNRRRRLATRSSGKQQAERTAVRTAPIVCPEESPLVRPWAYTSRCWGLTRRLRRGRWGCRPEGGSYFLSARKKVPKKASGTAILAARPAMRRGLRSAVAPSGLSSTLVRFAHPSGKKAPIAHFDGGARNVARNGVGQLTHTGGARSCSPFSAVKMGGPFSLRCLSPLCSAVTWVGMERSPCGLGCDGAAWPIQQGRRPAGLGNRVGWWREPRGQLPSGGKTPAELHVSLRPAPIGRGVGSRGTTPCRAAVTSQPSCMSF